MKNEPTLTVENVATYPQPGMAIPGSFKFNPDDSLLTYLFSPDGGLSRQLYAHNVQTDTQDLLVDATASGNSEENLSLEEKLRRERMRQRETGITHYAWGKNGQILIPLRGGISIQDNPQDGLRELIPSSNKPIIDPRFSPDGNWVAFVQDAEIYIIPTAGGASQQLTSGARGTGKTNGLAEFMAQEEMGRSHGFWWSPDSQSLAFVEVDETHIPNYRIMHQGKDTVGADAQENHRYPFAGEANAKVRLAIVSIDASNGVADAPIWMDLGDNEDIYLARVNWAGSGRLTAQILNREQTQLDLLSFNPRTGEGSLLLREETAVWINLHNLYHPLSDGFIWASERTGFQHLYWCDWEGGKQRPLTAGDWLVTSIAGVDTKKQRIYFTATKESPTETHLYAISFAGGDIERITTQSGSHAVLLNHAKTHFVDIHHAIDKSPTVTLTSLENPSADATAVFTQSDNPAAHLNLTLPEIITLENRDGTTLYGAIYRPSAQFGAGPFPTIVSVYGGPHAQRVTNSWGLTVDMRAQYLSQLGFLVFKLDNRGSARRGLAFEAPLKHNMGHVEVQDQVDGVHWLIEQGLTDPERVGIYGWSYGGYMALMCLALAGDVFETAVAGAPVTQWDGYDSCYTERYMGTPQSNPTGYQQSSVMAHVDKMKGNLLLVHGLIDENVHFRHTARLINALIHARKAYDLLLFPDERHMPRGLADRIYMEERIRDMFLDRL